MMLVLRWKPTRLREPDNNRQGGAAVLRQTCMMPSVTCSAEVT